MPEAKIQARDAEGAVSLVMVDGRAFVHGSVLDHECSERDGVIDALRVEKIAMENFLMRKGLFKEWADHKDHELAELYIHRDKIWNKRNRS